MFGIIIESFVYSWIAIIALLPNVLMAALTISVLGTVITYFEREKAE